MSDENNEKSHANEEELDVTSAKFNPLKALYAKNLKLPAENVKKLDNISIFISRLKSNAGCVEAEVKIHFLMCVLVILMKCLSAYTACPFN